MAHAFRAKHIFQTSDLLSVAVLAIFNFCFLGTEYLFDDRMALFTDSAGVVMAQNIVLGVSVIGFVLFSLLSGHLQGRKKSMAVAGWFTVCAACVLTIGCGHSYGVLLGAGILCFILMGIAGSAACYFVCRSVSRPGLLARTVGVSYALGILIQLFNNNIVRVSIYQAVFLAGFMLLFALCMVRMPETAAVPDEQNKPTIQPKKPALALTALIVCVFLMTVVFSTLDNAVTLVHASGEFNIGQWPRVLLAVSGLISGFLFDWHNRAYMPVIMYLIVLLSVISVLILQFGGSFVFGLLVFYLSAGFFAVFFTTGFMDLSFETRKPKLWAGMGRAVNNLCGIVLSGVSVSVIANGRPLFVMILTVILLILITVSLLVYRLPFHEAEREQLRMQEAERTKKRLADSFKEDKFNAFVKAHGFSEREKEVFHKLINSSAQISRISAELALSRATLYRHITNMNQKTGTDSRKDLIQYFYSWNHND